MSGEEGLCAEIIWRIENSSFFLSKFESLFSEKFIVESIGKFPWYLEIRVNPNDYLDCNIYTKMQKPEEDHTVVKFDFAVLDKNHTPQYLKETSTLTLSMFGGQGIDHFVPIEDLQEDPSYFLPKGVFTIRARIFNKESVLVSEVTKYFFRTVIPVKKCIFEWNVSTVSDITSESIRKIQLNSLFENDDSFNVTASYLQHEKDKCLKIHISGNYDVDKYCYECDVSNMKNNSIFLTTRDSLKTLPYEKVLKPLLSWKEMTKTPSKYFSNDTLKLNCKLIIILRKEMHYKDTENLKETLSDGTENELSTVTQNDSCSLKTAIFKMYHEKIMVDFKIQVDSYTFDVHSSVLASRSPVLRRMLETNMKEKQDKTLQLEDLEVETVKQLLDYLYTDDPGSLCVNSALKLYYASDKYLLEGLKTLSTNFLKENLDSWNVFEVLMLSDRHNDKELMSSAVQFISRHEKDVIHSDEFVLFSKENLQLSSEIVLALYKAKLQ